MDFSMERILSRLVVIRHAATIHLPTNRESGAIHIYALIFNQTKKKDIEEEKGEKFYNNNDFS